MSASIGLTPLQYEYPELSAAVRATSGGQRRAALREACLVGLRRTDLASETKEEIAKALQGSVGTDAGFVGRLRRLQEDADSEYLDALDDDAPLDADQRTLGRRRHLAAKAERARVRARALWAVVELLDHSERADEILYESMATGPTEGPESDESVATARRGLDRRRARIPPATLRASRPYFGTRPAAARRSKRAFGGVRRPKVRAGAKRAHGSRVPRA